ncbi:MAG: VCBS repeat-containing protein [Pseudomonadota bacterium]
MFARSLIAAFVAACGAAGGARTDWAATPLDPRDRPEDIVAEARAGAASVSDDPLPDGLVATGDLDVAAAWYEAPTTRYAHGILGDAVEAGTLAVRTVDGEAIRFALPDTHVYEDRYPRIADLDGDGRAEIVTIRASRRGGGGIAVYGLRDGALEEVASVPDIGTPNRWLNIAAIADLNGDGGLEIAFVKTPHIGGTLRIFAFYAGELRLVDELWGFSNHAIGAREMRLSALIDLDGRPTLAVPSADRRALRIVRLGNAIREVASVDLPARIDKAVAADGDGFVVGLSDGSVMRVGR